MHSRYLLAAFVSLWLITVACPMFALDWTHTWGGGADDYAASVVTDSSGNIYAAGATSSFGAGGQDVLLAKYDSTGNLLPGWPKTWGGPGDEFATAIALDSGGNIYVTGGTTSFGAGWYDVFLLKFDSSGNILWEKTWGGPSYDVAWGISFDSSGDVLVAAESYNYVLANYSSAAVLKFTPNGDLLWSRIWDSGVSGSIYDGAYSLDTDSSGNIFVSGITWDYNVSPHHNSIFIIKYDSSGNLLWNRNWAGSGEDEAWGGTKTVRADSVGNVYVAGRTANQCSTDDFSLCDFDVSILKLDAGGNFLWSRTWKPDTGYDTAESLTFDNVGNLVITGQKDVYGPSAAAFLLRYDPSGNLLSSETWSGVPGSFGASATVSPIGDIIVTGGALNNIGSWVEATGISGTENGTLSAQSSQIGWVNITLGEPTGTITSPSGVIDIGGGGGDVFISKIEQMYPHVLIVPGILGTKMSVANWYDCFLIPPPASPSLIAAVPSCVAWLSNAQIINGGFLNKLSAASPAFSALEYTLNGEPTVPLVLNDIFNLVPDPTFFDLGDDLLDCNQWPISLIAPANCSRLINVYNPLRDQLQQAGFSVTTFPYDWRGDISDLGDQLYSAVQQLIQPQGSSQQVAIIAHSMGGMVVGEMLRNHPDIESSLSNIVTLGTPFGGSVDAYMELQGWKSLEEDFLTTTATKAIGQYWTSPYLLLPQQPFVLDMNNNLVKNNNTIYEGTSFSPTLFPALARQSAVQRAYSFWSDVSNWNQNTDFTVLASKTLAIVGAGFPTLTNIGVSNSVSNPMNPNSSIPLASSCRDWIHGNGDGTVSVDSATSSRWAQNIRYVQEEHLLLPSNQNVINAVMIFLNEGNLNVLPNNSIPNASIFEIRGCSPVELNVQASGGQLVADGLIQVNGAHYIASDHGTQITIPTGDEYNLTVQGTGVGIMTLIITRSDGSTQGAVFPNIPVAPATTGTLSITDNGVSALQLTTGNTMVSISADTSLTANEDINVLSAIIGTLQLPAGTANDLQYKLDAASADLSSGDQQGAVGMLSAFENEVMAQTAYLSADTAAGLNSIAGEIISSFAGCATDVSSSVSVTRAGYVFNFGTQRFYQTVTLKNTGGSTINGPISLVLDSLSSNASLYNASGSTSCAAPLGSPYINVSAASLVPGASVSVSLQFTDPTKATTTYNTRVLAGSGAR
jgi:pimeloyl-ACP methyl ester carboxylesterase